MKFTKFFYPGLLDYKSAGFIDNYSEIYSKKWEMTGRSYFAVLG